MDSKRIEEDKPAQSEESRRAGSFHGCRSIVVGLTGGIATGKTTIGLMLESFGAKFVSADQVVHSLMAPETDVWREVVEEFGDSIITSDGEIDRSRLGEIVFHDARKLKRLEEIIHPRVLGCLSEEAERFRKEEAGILVLEIPLLIETSSMHIVDKVLVVTAEQESQIKRLKDRYGANREEALLRIESQLPLSEKVKYADWVISTEGVLQSIKEHLQRVWLALQKALAQP